jgi:predicted DNA-binding transcriptional regulator AlpA
VSSIELTDDALLTPKQLAEYTNLKPKTLETMRRRGDGPRFIKFGRSVRYRGIDISEYLDDQTRESTTESKLSKAL